MVQMILFSFVSLWTSLALSQAEDLSQINPLTARAYLTSKSIQAGELTDLKIEIDVQDGFSAYHDRFHLKPLAPQDITVGELFIDPIVEFYDSISKKKKKGVRKHAQITTQIAIPLSLNAKQNQLDFELSYIACTEKYCLTPRRVPLTISLDGMKITSAEIKSEPTLSDPSSFIQHQINTNLPYALVLIFFFGFMTSLTPCIYPLIPITLAILGTEKQGSSLRSFLVSLSYVLGIATTYALLGVVAAQTGQLFGSFISHPIVIILMCLIFIAMGLSLIGVFEIQPPAFIRNRLSSTQSQRGRLGAYLSGLVAGVVASPCVGPVLVGILASIAKTQNSTLGFVLLFTFAMGFGILFLVMGTFSHLTHKLPRSGVWMNGVKYFLAICMFALAFYYSWPLVKPYIKKPTVSQSSYKVKWQAYSPEAVQAAKGQKPIIVDFYADWCLACVEMDELTFSQNKVIDLSQEFVMLKVDATSPSKELNEWQQLYKVHGLPTMIFINRQGDVVEDLTLTGFEETDPFAERMQKLLEL